MPAKVLHQFTEAAFVGDATGDHVFMIQRWLRELGFISEVYAEHYPPELEKVVRPAVTYRPRTQEELVIYHHTLGSRIADRLLAQSIRLILIYHNITPPEFFATTDPALTEELIKGREQLLLMRPVTDLALGASPYSECELRQVGFAQTGVLPIVLDESRYQLAAGPHIKAAFQGKGPIFLFVGRLAPNKKQEDLIKLLYYYRRLEPAAHLIIAGSVHQANYQSWLQELAATLNLADGVTFTGHITQAELVSYYQMADLFVSMSEHEGFGKPLIESMYLGLPVMAYAATAVPSTMGHAGALFHRKDYEALAELADILIKDHALKQRLIGRQQERVATFLAGQVRQEWRSFLARLQLIDIHPDE
jgi:L-malate glycosyltransferase